MYSGIYMKMKGCGAMNDIKRFIFEEDAVSTVEIILIVVEIEGTTIECLT